MSNRDLDMPRFKTIKEAQKNTEKDLANIMRAGAIKVFGAIIEQSPIGNRELWKINQNRGKRKLQPAKYVGGTFRGNWQASINAPKTEVIPDDVAVKRKERVEQSLSGKISLKDVMYLTNNLPYALPLEQGHSTQRPSGWIRTIIEAGHADLQKIAAKYRGVF